MKYRVNGYNAEPIDFDNKEEAEAFLKQKQEDILAYEAVRFSICATFVNGNDTTWRNVEESDPEDTVCQVFDTFTGQYTECKNKTDAYSLNKEKQNKFLQNVGLDKVYEIDKNLPNEPI